MRCNVLPSYSNLVDEFPSEVTIQHTVPVIHKKDTPFGMSFLWWAEVDSNHRSRRRQIYSLIHLAALESAQNLSVASCAALWWSRWLDSNPQPADYKSAALPIELHRRVFGALGRNWTTDRQIFSLLLYRLSYQGIWRPKTGSNRRPPAWQAGALTNWATGP